MVPSCDARERRYLHLPVKARKDAMLNPQLTHAGVLCGSSTGCYAELTTSRFRPATAKNSGHQCQPLSDTANHKNMHWAASWIRMGKQIIRGMTWCLLAYGQSHTCQRGPGGMQCYHQLGGSNASCGTGCWAKATSTLRVVQWHAFCCGKSALYHISRRCTQMVMLSGGPCACAL